MVEWICVLDKDIDLYEIVGINNLVGKGKDDIKRSLVSVMVFILERDVL